MLGGTPAFYGGATANPTDLGAWTRYVRAVASRYSASTATAASRRIRCGTRANVKNYWTGSPAQMAELTKARTTDCQGRRPGALVVGPAFAGRIAEQTRGIGFFYNYQVPGQPGPVWRYLDAISLNLYPKAKYGDKPGHPRDVDGAAGRRPQTQMRLRGVPERKPIWNTEYQTTDGGGTNGGTARQVGSRRAAGRLRLRTYLLNAARVSSRVHWYTWNKGTAGGSTLGNTKMTAGHRHAATLAGKSFALARPGLDVRRQAGRCRDRPPSRAPRSRAGTYTCVIKYKEA